MLKALQKLFGGDSNDRDLKKIWPIVDEINERFERLEHVTDDELKAKTAEFKARIQEAAAPIEAEQAEIRARLLAAGGDDADADPTTGATLSVRDRQDLYQQLDDLEGDWLDAVEDVLDSVLPEAFAVIKETCRRFLGKTWVAGGSEIEWQMVPFDVQLLGGVVLHRGQVAEMKTGEGKTLTSVAPIYLNALVGRGVHVVTVNPYLAQRDAEWMAPVFEFHGLTVDCIDAHRSHSPERRAAYRADITYGTNNEFGFDYLRDNSFVVDAGQLVQRHHHYAIVDEVDSVLIDEARTPLIISGPVPQASASTSTRSSSRRSKNSSATRSSSSPATSPTPSASSARPTSSRPTATRRTRTGSATRPGWRSSAPSAGTRATSSSSSSRARRASRCSSARSRRSTSQKVRQADAPRSTSRCSSRSKRPSTSSR